MLRPNVTTMVGLAMVAMLVTIGVGGMVSQVKAECDLPGTAHGDNHKSESKGEKMMKSGASACELAKAYDAHKIDFQISQKEMKQYSFYKNADSDLKKELDEYAKQGNGAKGLVAYEVKDAVEQAD